MPTLSSRLSRLRLPLLLSALLCLLAGGLASGTVQAAPLAQTNVPFRVYLTFEDGPTDAYTPQILDTLAQYGAKATFLINGWQIKGHEALLQREIREGHAIVNHLWEEPGYYAGSDPDKIREAYRRTETAIIEALGADRALYDAQVKMFWQPGGGTQPLPEIEGVQVITYNANVDGDDCGWKLVGVDLDTLAFDQAVTDNILNVPQSTGQIYNAYDYGDGVIIALHDINRVTGRILPGVLAELQSAGATFEALPRPWDSVGSMPVHIAEPPAATPGIAGAVMRGQILLDYARLRNAPTLAGDILNTLAPDTEVIAIGRAPGWIKVQAGDQLGWIADSLIKVYGPIPSLPLEA